MKSVTLFRDYFEDRRTSMEVYGDNLAAQFTASPCEEFTIQEYRPELTAMIRVLPEKFNLQMRMARYVSYPSQARHVQGEINHILDHGYAHLLLTLDPKRTVITVHDIIPVLAGQGKIPGVVPGRRNRLSEFSASFLNKAAHIIAISSSTRQDLITHCGCSPDRISVVYYGLQPGFRHFSDQEQAQCRSNLNLPDMSTKLVLITGAEFYKNQSTSLQVFEKLLSISKQPIKLVRLGRKSGKWNAMLQKSSAVEHTIHLEYLSPEKMVDLYNGVDCLLFPSWYEGFGLPPVEAMACGTPVVTSNRASLPEAVGDAALIFDPDDVDGLARAVADLLQDKGYREKQITKGYKQIQRFSWQRNARQTRDIYQRVARQL